MLVVFLDFQIILIGRIVLNMNLVLIYVILYSFPLITIYNALLGHDPKSNFTMISFYLTVLDIQPQSERILQPFLTSIIPPNQTLDPIQRFKTLYFPYYEKLKLSNPDLLILNSGLWDMIQVLGLKSNQVSFFDRYTDIIDSKLIQPLLQHFPSKTPFILRSCGSVSDYQKDVYSKNLLNTSLLLEDTVFTFFIFSFYYEILVYPICEYRITQIITKYKWNMDGFL